VWITSSLANVLTPTAVALGNFDGVHQGHRQVIQPILKPSGNRANQGCHATVVTFDPHPQEFFSGQPRTLLTPLNEKVAQLKTMGVAQLVLLPFNRELASLAPDQFVHHILVKGLQAQQISVGSDFCFGQKRAGTTEDLCNLVARYGIEVAIAPLKLLNSERISSSAIRQALQEGKIQQANYLLGRPYSLVGQVIPGQQLGRTLGFPTANLKLAKQKFLPRHGVYAVWVQICETNDDLESCATPPRPAVMNIGHRPTINGNQLVAEVHLFNWTQDLYGQVLVINLEQFLRPEQRFDSIEQLKSQIQIDCQTAQTLLVVNS
jgi:riboflavin kinase/FMN adenylyltransferase